MHQFLSESDLEQLPMRAIVAIVWRAAKRVRELKNSPQLPIPVVEEHSKVITDESLRVARDFCIGGLTQVVATGEMQNPDLELQDTTLSTDFVALAAIHARLAALMFAMNAPLVERNRNAVGGLCRPPLNIARSAVMYSLRAVEFRGFDTKPAKAAVMNDFQRLLEMKMGLFPELGALVEPGDDGPLGKLQQLLPP